MGTTARLVVLLLLGAHVAVAADVDAWRSQIIYFLLTDRFAPAPGVQPGPCKLNEFNNGSWAGITHNLDFIQDMGMTAIWITPIPYQYQGQTFGESAYHGYWAQDWTRLDPHWGTEKDLTDFIQAAHDRDMLTMLDVVVNHVGPVEWNFTQVVPFNKLEHYNNCTLCAEYCAIPVAAYDPADLLPRRQPETYQVQHCRLVNLPDLNQSHPLVRDYLTSWLQKTLQKFPFDAIRIDTVKHVETGFFKDYTAAAKTFSMGEVLNGNTRFISEYVRPGADGRKPMDTVLNFPLYYRLINTFARQQDLRELAAERKLQHEVLGLDQVHLLGNFLDNHDHPRFLTMQPDVVLFKNALTWMLLAEGIPIIYYGSTAQAKGDNNDGHNRACLWENSYSKERELYRLIGTLSKLRTDREVWNINERADNVTADCYTYTVGQHLLVVTTNKGSNPLNASKSCTVTLPASSLLMQHGLREVQDVLDYNQSDHTAPKGVTWESTSGQLLIEMPGGEPRVLTSTRFEPSYIAHNSSEIKGIAKPAVKDDVKIAWGNEPEAGASNSAAGSYAVGVAVSVRGFIVAAVTLLLMQKLY